MTIAKELEKQRSVKAKRLQKDENIYFKAEEFWLNKNGCPIGTVPIRRLTQEQLQNAKDASLRISINASPEIKSFTSATATVTLYNLHVNGLGQYSSATIFHQSADSATNFEQIQAGWIVHPQLYGDSRTRLYSHWTVNGGLKTGCYNNICPGFVQLDTTVPIDYAFPKISRPMYDDYELEIQIYKDEDYYLLFQGFISIGFWPETLFNELRNGSQVVRYGGQAFTPAGQQYSPPMGNGNFQDGNPHTTCHMRQVLYGVGYNQLVQPDESLVQTHQSRCYHEGSQHNAHDDYWDYNFLFGGGGFC
uniref:Neprosin PEP catalytic domain-containing protein n=1 Tax=Solanum tuberosum TaxID=4113 RepID=M1DSD0_SOLTU